MGRKPFVNYGKPDKPKKEKSGVKLIQPIIIEWALAKTLVEAKAMKAPTVPKMESMEKWILARGWDLSIEHDKNIGLTVASIVCPGLDNPLTFTGSDATMALATAKAIGEAYTKGPRQKSFTDDSSDDFDDEANEPDRPSNGQTSFVTVDLEQEGTATNDDPSGTAAEDIQSESAVFDTGDLPPDEAPAPYSLGEPIEPVPADDWRFLFIVDPADGALWKSNLATDGDTHIVEFETGETDGAPNDFDRGWYIDPSYTYDHRAGTITAADNRIVWVRLNAQRSHDESAGILQPSAPDFAERLEAATADSTIAEVDSQAAAENPAVDFIMSGVSTTIEKLAKSKKDKAPKVSNRTADEAEALQKAGVAESGDLF